MEQIYTNARTPEFLLMLCSRIW